MKQKTGILICIIFRLHVCISNTTFFVFLYSFIFLLLKTDFLHSLYFDNGFLSLFLPGFFLTRLPSESQLFSLIIMFNDDILQFHSEHNGVIIKKSANLLKEK